MYYLVYGFFYLISLLPFWFMYLLSDVAGFVLYYIIRYRRAVVSNNLAIAFPQKTSAERKKIGRDFYTHFTDNWVEFIKLISISKAALNKRFTGGYAALNELYNSGYKVQVHLGHCFNWEYANVAYGMNVQSPFIVVYKPISSGIMDRIFYKVRTRFGSNLISSYNFRKEFAPYMRKPFALVLVADQKEFPRNAYWTPFFSKMTTFVQGPERTARFNNAAITMSNIVRLRRGYYHSEIVLLTKEPRTLPEGEITKRMVAFIEDCIRRQPANYLWSHKRWKYTFDASQHVAL